jgi:PKD repeat protein
VVSWWTRLFCVVAIAVAMTAAVATMPVVAQSNEAPTASFQYSPTDPDVNESVSFTASAADVDGDIVSYEWFVDGEGVDTGDTMSHSFATSGSIQVRLTVTDDDGATTNAVQTVDVSGDTGGLDVSIDYTPNDPRAGSTITFEVDASETASSYVWRFGDGDSGSGPFASHSYDAPGTYTVELVAEDDDARATATTDVEVGSGDPGAPRVSIGVTPQDPSVGQRVAFEARASDPDGSVELYQWRIDGASVGAGGIYRHTFDEGGTHDVAVTVTDNAGMTANASTSIDVADDNMGPTATIDYDPVSPNAGEPVTLTANARDSDGSVASYDWIVDGESAGRGESVTHTFDEGGDATVRLTVTDDDGASVTAETSFGVGPAVDTENDDAENASDGSNGGGGEGLPGFTVVAALAALAALTTAAFVRRR